MINKEKMKVLKSNIIVFILMIFSFSSKEQGICDTLPFINCQDNIIVVHDSKINTLIQKFRNLNSQRNSLINIVHIGDSHLQAGFLSEKIKHGLFQYYSSKDTIVSPGFIFPYTIAQTNNPFFYKINYTGNWDWCKNIDSEKICKLGLSGITVRTNDSVASLSIKMQNEKYDYPQKYYFNTIKIFHNTDSSFCIKVNGEKAISKNDYSEFKLNYLTDSILITINVNDTSKFFELYGIILENNTSKINYHTIGVNGATAQSYLKCDYFSRQLSIINPDLIIISLGTNEAYDKDFSTLQYEYILKDLLLQIKDTVHQASILLVTPNDHIKKNECNKNVLKVRNTIIKVCKEFNLCCWDFYSIMGGAKSMNDWYNRELTGKDKIHFKKKGYEIQGELFVKAFTKMIESNEKNE